MTTNDNFWCGQHPDNSDPKCYSCFLAKRENAKPVEEQIVFRSTKDEDRDHASTATR
jgi:hypothetical protein